MKELGTTELAFGGKVFKLILMLRTNVTPWMVNDVGKQRKSPFCSRKPAGRLGPTESMIKIF